MNHVFTWKANGREHYLLLDVESGAIHRLDKTAYDIASVLERGKEPRSLAYPQEVVEEVLSELMMLRKEGLLDAEELTPHMPAGGAVIKSMCLHVAHDCNLRCKYCFASTGEFQGTRMLMPFAVAKQALDFLIERSGTRRNLEVDLFGGEPLMNFAVVKEIVAYGRKLEKAHDKTIHFTITTNGLALNDEIIDYINAEMHNVVLSLDGRPDIHDMLRPTANGKGSYAVILKNAKKLIEKRGDKEYYVRGTFTNRNLDFTKDVRYLREEGFEQISLEPVVLGKDDPYAICPEHIDEICAEYDRLAEFKQASEAEGKGFHFFHFMLDLENGPCLHKRITGCGAGSEYVAVTPEGDLYPCHQFVGETDYRLGNVMDGTFHTEIPLSFQACNVRTKEACSHCWAKYFCSGGCAANAYKYNGDIYQPERITCALLKKRTECAIGLNVIHE